MEEYRPISSVFNDLREPARVQWSYMEPSKALVGDRRHLNAGELLQPFSEEILRGGNAEMPLVDAPRI